MNAEEIAKRLKEPFNYGEIQWRLLNITQDKARGLAVAFLDARAVQRRLDDTVGIYNWRNEYNNWQDNSQVCGLSIYCEERKEWITKCDGGENTDIESIKGGLSDAFKRSAVLWGIGRYLYEIGSIWVEIEPKGKSFAIKHDQQAKLEIEYKKAVDKIFQSSISTLDKQPPTLKNTETKQKPTASDDKFTVKSIKPSGKSSQLLELLNPNGQIINAYVKTSDRAITAGSCLQKVQIERRNSNYGEYNLLVAYQAA